MNSEMIKVEGLRKSYGDNEVLKGIDVTIAEQEVVVVIGPSGGGKKYLPPVPELSGGAHIRHHYL